MQKKSSSSRNLAELQHPRPFNVKPKFIGIRNFRDEGERSK